MGIKPDVYESCLLKGKDGKPLAPEYLAACSWASDVLSRTLKEDVLSHTLKEDVLSRTQKEDVLSCTQKEDVLSRTQKEDVLSRTQKEDAHVNFLFSKPFHKIQHPDNPDFAVFMKNVMEY